MQTLCKSFLSQPLKQLAKPTSVSTLSRSNISNISKGLLIQKRAPCGFQIRNAS